MFYKLTIDKNFVNMAHNSQRAKPSYSATEGYDEYRVSDSYSTVTDFARFLG